MKYLKTYEISNVNVVKELIKSGAMSIHSQMKIGNVNVVKELIKSGADLNVKDESGHTPLIFSVINNQYEIFKELINAGADLDVQDKDGDTALINASVMDKYDFMYDLIEAGADWNIKDTGNNDFLFYQNAPNQKEIKRKYPEQYKIYLMKKDAEKYNL